MNDSTYFLKNNKSANFAVHNDFMYGKQSSKNETDYYRCKERNCKARLILVNNKFSNQSKLHNHPSHKVDILRQLAINEMKIKVIFIYFTII
jgi:hypothetical protein